MSLPARLALSVMVLSLVAACSKGDGAPGGGPGGAGGPPAVVTAHTVALEPWQDTLEAVGTARSSEAIVITSKLSERVERVRFESGQRVAAGDVLVDLDTGGDVADLEAARTAYREAQRQYNRQQELAASRLIATSALDAQRAARDAAQARVQQAMARVGDRVIVAPFAGVLGLREVSNGQLLSPGTPITTLDATDTMQVDFPIPEVQLALVQAGLKVRARSDAWPGTAFDGEVVSVDSRVDAATRSVMVRATVANPEGKILPGMLLTVEVERPQRQSLVLPEIAVQQNGAQSFVFRLDDKNAAQTAPVTVGSRQPGRVEIVEGLSAGDRVVIDGAVKLRPGDTVRVAEPAATDDEG